MADQNQTTIEDATTKDGLVRMQAPEGCGGASVDGVAYEVKDGHILARAAHVTELQIHGFALKSKK